MEGKWGGSYPIITAVRHGCSLFVNEHGGTTRIRQFDEIRSTNSLFIRSFIIGRRWNVAYNIEVRSLILTFKKQSIRNDGTITRVRSAASGRKTRSCARYTTLVCCRLKSWRSEGGGRAGVRTGTRAGAVGGEDVVEFAYVSLFQNFLAMAFCWKWGRDGIQGQDDSILTDRSCIDKREQRSNNREDEEVVHGYNRFALSRYPNADPDYIQDQEITETRMARMLQSGCMLEFEYTRARSSLESV